MARKRCSLKTNRRKAAIGPVFYVYVLFRPDGTPCYVGKGTGPRWLTHEMRARGIRKPRLPALQDIIVQAGGTLRKIKICENMLEDDAYALEQNLILFIGRGNRGPLVNTSDGGRGPLGHAQSEEQVAKKRIENLSDEQRLLLSKAHRGHVASFETRQKMSNSQLARWQSLPRNTKGTVEHG